MKKVVLFVNKKCVHCQFAKKLLLDKGIFFEEKDIENVEIRRELFKKQIKSVPTFCIDDTVIVGINIVKIDELLNSINN